LSIEAFYIEEAWRNATNPFLAAAFEAASRGVVVRILVDGSWSSVEADSGTNDDVVARINRAAKEQRLPLEARLLEPRGSIERLPPDLIAAADVEKFGYCPLSWWLSRGLAPEEGPELGEGEKKHEAAAADLRGIEAHEAQAREAEAGVLYFAIAASIVATVGLRFITTS